MSKILQYTLRLLKMCYHSAQTVLKFFTYHPWPQVVSLSYNFIEDELKNNQQYIYLDNKN